MASFQAKNWLEMAQKETKIQIIVSFRSYPMRNRKFQTNSKKIQKIIKYYCGFILSQNRLEKAEKERTTISFRYYPTHKRKFQKNRKKIWKI